MELSFSNFLLSRLGHWAAMGTLPACPTPAACGLGMRPASVLFLCFVSRGGMGFHASRVLTLLLTFFTMLMRFFLLFQGSKLCPLCPIYITHSCPPCLSLCLSFALLLYLSYSSCCPPLSNLCWSLLLLLKLLIATSCAYCSLYSSLLVQFSINTDVI